MGYAPRLNADTALRNTRDLLNVLRECGINAWVQDGTLLGLVRDGAIIPWDHDTDTGALVSEWNEVAMAALQRAGFTLAKTLGSRENGWQHRWTRKGVKTDIFFYYPNEDGSVWHAAYVNGSKQYRFTYPERFSLAPISTKFGPIPAPSPPEAFLETKYGTDWRTPKRNWHFALSPVNASRA